MATPSSVPGFQHLTNALWLLQQAHRLPIAYYPITCRLPSYFLFKKIGWFDQTTRYRLMATDIFLLHHGSVCRLPRQSLPSTGASLEICVYFTKDKNSPIRPHGQNPWGMNRTLLLGNDKPVFNILIYP